jgi:hypothetical protein
VEKEEQVRFVNASKAQVEKVIVPTTTNVYDIDGNLVEQHIYTVEGALAFKYMLIRDENRLLTELQTLEGGKTARQTFDFEASVNNKLLNKRFRGVLQSSNRPELGTQVFDSEGNMIEWQWPRKQQRNVSTYEHDGRVKESFVYDGYVNTIRSRFEYTDDEKGNWIEKREFTYFPSRPEAGWSEGTVTYRELTYFS